MHSVGIVICNYNKKNYIISCIQSVLKQSYTDFDIYVVDNASTDGSADAIKNEFGNTVYLLQNEENFGGSGGFNSGIRYAMNKSYSYIMLLDNDVILEENAVQNLVNDMENNRKIGIMGCKILKMDEPDIIQEFAPILNYETLTFELSHGGEKDSDLLPHLEYCDYVPACAMIVRRNVIEKIGLMPEENFIYYDDIEWGVRCNKSGWKVAANSKAVAWHKGGAGINPTTFSNYYLLRNKIKFFTTYMKTETQNLPTDEEITRRVDLILREVFEGIYSCHYRGYKNIAATRMDAFIDALEEKNNKTEDYKIRNLEQLKGQMEILLEQYHEIHIFINGYWEAVRKIVLGIKSYAKKNKKEFKIYLYGDKGEKDNVLEISVREEKEYLCNEGLTLYVCNHIYKHHIDSKEKNWIDGWGNMLLTEEDYIARNLYEKEYQLFKCCFEDKVHHLILKNMRII